MLNKNGFRLQPVLNYKSGMVDSLEVEFASLKLAHQNEVKVLLQLEHARSRGMDALRCQQQGVLDCETIRLHQQYLDMLDTQATQQTIG